MSAYVLRVGNPTNVLQSYCYMLEVDEFKLVWYENLWNRISKLSILRVAALLLRCFMVE